MAAIAPSRTKGSVGKSQIPWPRLIPEARSHSRVILRISDCPRLSTRRATRGVISAGSVADQIGKCKRVRLARAKQKGPDLAVRALLLTPYRGITRDSEALLRFGERPIDQLLELRERLRAAHEVAVDHERRGSRDSGVVADLRIGVDLCLVGAVVERRLELGQVEPDLFGVLLERRALDAVR